MVASLDIINYWQDFLSNQKPPISQKGWFLSGGTHDFKLQQVPSVTDLISITNVIAERNILFTIKIAYVNIDKVLAIC